MELQQPLALLHVALPSREILGVARVDEKHLQAARLQDVVQGNPIDARGRHGHGRDPTLHQPRRQAMQIGGEALEAADRVGIAGMSIWAIRPSPTPFSTQAHSLALTGPSRPKTEPPPKPDAD